MQYQMVFIPEDFSNSYVVTHWTNLGDYSVTSDAPFDASLINSTQTLPAPSSQDTNAAYAASPSAIVQLDSSGNIYYLNNPISSYKVNSDASWTKMDYTLSGASGSSSSSSASSSASGTAAAGSGSSASATSTGSKTSGSSGSSASGSSTPSSTGSTSASIRFDLAGLALGLVTVGTAFVL